jgi:hypothetical protein
MESTLLQKLAEQGLLGMLFVLALLTIYFFYKEVRKERCDRLTDMKQVWQDDIKFREELKTLNENTLAVLQKIFDFLINNKLKGK